MARPKFYITHDSNDRPASIVDKVGTVLATSDGSGWSVVDGKNSLDLDFFITNECGSFLNLNYDARDSA